VRCVDGREQSHRLGDDLLGDREVVEVVHRRRTVEGVDLVVEAFADVVVVGERPERDGEQAGGGVVTGEDHRRHPVLQALVGSIAASCHRELRRICSTIPSA
jgi:hypothetical protein